MYFGVGEQVWLADYNETEYFRVPPEASARGLFGFCSEFFRAADEDAARAYILSRYPDATPVFHHAKHMTNKPIC
jgi:hypothetical protein